MNRILDVYYNQNFVGELTQNENGDLAFTYNTTYINGNNPPISLSLPLISDTYIGRTVDSFFSGLLPEDHIRQRLERKYGISSGNTFALLHAIGEDCAGAISVYEQGKKPPLPATKMIDIAQGELLEILKNVSAYPSFTQGSNNRLSLAGAQEKLPIRFFDDTVYLTAHGTPSTHIIKPPVEWVVDSVYNEYFCMQLAQKVGLNTPETNVKYIQGIPHYIITRYDRIQDKAGYTNRIHQEDFCQIMGILPQNKYQNEGGPSIDNCQEILTKHSATPAICNRAFFHRVLFNFLIGNNDAHGKNFSMLYTGQKPTLAPAYDMLCTAVYPELSQKMAMKVGKHYNYRYVYRPSFYRIAGNNQNLADMYIDKMIQTIIPSAYAVKSDLQQQNIQSPIIDKIIDIIKIRSQKLEV